MRIIYQAFDGKNFSSEKECLAYEEKEKLQEVVDAVVILDYNKNILPYAEMGEQVFQLGYYVALKSDRAAEIMSEIAEKAGYQFPNAEGFYYYDEEDNEFYELSQKIRELEESLTHYDNILAKLKGE